MCGGNYVNFGAGCAGSGGFVPELEIFGCASPGDQQVFSISKGLGGSQWLLLTGFGQAAAPIGGGCTFNIATPIPAVIGPLPLPGSGAGNGALAFEITVPPDLTALVGLTVVHQVLIIDPGNPLGFVGTNGVQVSLG